MAKKVELPGLTVNTDPSADKTTITLPGAPNITSGTNTSTSSTSTITTSSVHDATTKVDGALTSAVHTETGPTTIVSGDAAQPADQQG